MDAETSYLGHLLQLSLVYQQRTESKVEPPGHELAHTRDAAVARAGLTHYAATLAPLAVR